MITKLTAANRVVHSLLALRAPLEEPVIRARLRAAKRSRV